MFTDRDLVVMIEVAQELRAAIKKGETPDVQAVEDLCGFVLAQNEAFPDDDDDDPAVTAANTLPRNALLDAAKAGQELGTCDDD
jgi:hypothetical protein